MRTQSLFRGTIAVPAMLFSFNSAALQSVRTDFGELVGEEEYVGILSSMPLKHNADGSLDIYIQAKSPGSHKESNWLLASPSGMFNLTFRIYQPEQEALDGTYKLPPVAKAQ